MRSPASFSVIFLFSDFQFSQWTILLKMNSKETFSKMLEVKFMASHSNVFVCFRSFSKRNHLFGIRSNWNRGNLKIIFIS